jgi:hypothetical protein
MVVDAVLANDEWDLVLFRLEYLAPAVQKFYIGESSVMFSGLPKEKFFAGKVKQLRDKGFDVEIVDLDIPESLLAGGERWAIETHARNTLLEVVCNRHKDDLVLFSDVDEVPSLAQVEELVGSMTGLTIASIPTQVCLRKANWIEYHPHQWRGKWGNGLVGKYWVPRIRRGKYPLVGGEPGAHLSYVGMTAADVRRKYQAFSHGELDRDSVASEEFLAFADYFHISHIGRALEPGAGLLTVVQPADFTGLQRAAFDKYPSWFSIDPVHQSRIRRLIASWLLFNEVRGTPRGKFSDAMAPLYSWVWLRHALTYVIVWVGWRTLTGLGLLRLLGLLRPGVKNVP